MAQTDLTIVKMLDSMRLLIQRCVLSFGYSIVAVWVVVDGNDVFK